MTNDRPDTTDHTPLGHIEAWLFDLDNTLYPHECNLFRQVDARMKEFIIGLLGCNWDEAHDVQKSMFRKYGTTMRGLMTEHDVAPDEFLAHVHDIDHAPVPADPALDAALGRLEGPKYIFTNASVAHAEKVLERVGIAHHFEAIFDIVAADYLPKPNPHPYTKVVEAHGLAPEATVFFDDIPKNLAPAHALGMTTVWIRTDTEYATVGEPGEHIHHETREIGRFLEGVAAARDRNGSTPTD